MDTTPRKHAFCSASSSKRWSKCTASPGFIRRERAAGRIPKRKDTKYSLEGEKAHELANICLQVGFTPELFDEPTMAKHIKRYVEVIDGWREIPGSTTYLEQAVPLFYWPDEQGFLDAGVVDPVGKRVFVGDLKYGAGVYVEVKGNTQIGTYALSLIDLLRELYSIDDSWIVVMMIFQPRLQDESEDGVRLWSVKLGDLRAEMAPLEITAIEIYLDPDGGVFAPSDSTCQFCDAAGGCNHRAADIFGGLPGEVSPVANLRPQYPPADSMTLEQISRVVAKAPELRAWLSSIEAAAFQRLDAGMPMPGFKLVTGRSVRQWRDDSEVPELLAMTELPEDEWYKPLDFISAPQAQGKLSKQDWEKVKHAVVKPKGKPTMVPENDDRTTIVANPVDAFEDLTQDVGSASGNQLLLA